MPLAVASLTSICSKPVLYELMILRFDPAVSITFASILSVSVHRIPAMPATLFSISFLFGGRGFLFTIKWHSLESIERAGSGILLVIYTLVLFTALLVLQTAFLLIIIARPRFELGSRAPKAPMLGRYIQWKKNFSSTGLPG